jgi:hypothetical protein
MNPRAAYGTIKLHKQYKPIRPIVNLKGSPTYKAVNYTYMELINMYEFGHLRRRGKS